MVDPVGVFDHEHGGPVTQATFDIGAGRVQNVLVEPAGLRGLGHVAHGRFETQQGRQQRQQRLGGKASLDEMTAEELKLLCSSAVSLDTDLPLQQPTHRMKPRILEEGGAGQLDHGGSIGAGHGHEARSQIRLSHPGLTPQEHNRSHILTPTGRAPDTAQSGPFVDPTDQRGP